MRKKRNAGEKTCTLGENSMQTIFDFFSGMGEEFALFVVSMIPIIELRGAIPLGASLGMNWAAVYVISVIGNLIPVPFIILFGRKILNWLKSTRAFSRFAHWGEAHLMKKADRLMKYSALGLMLFVLVPVPGTGAWSGAALAVLLNLRMKYALPSISLGVLGAGAIMTIGSYGLFGAMRLF
ncbi:MAG: small multi-drug export protein [Oscillospiraceae bacterium]|nr:small multi-drug export protein [Oscillospiraceae bacterium]